MNETQVKEILRDLKIAEDVVYDLRDKFAHRLLHIATLLHESWDVEDVGDLTCDTFDVVWTEESHGSQESYADNYPIWFLWSSDDEVREFKKSRTAAREREAERVQVLAQIQQLDANAARMHTERETLRKKLELL